MAIRYGRAVESRAPEKSSRIVGSRHNAADLGWAAGTRIGRLFLSVLLGFLAVSLVIWNLPDSDLRAKLRPTLRPVVNSMAIDQSWSVFAPNPTTLSIAVEADVHLADGTVERYTFPAGDDFLGAYREYRWRKWERRVRLDINDHLWVQTARWVAMRFPEGQVDRVVLIRRFSETPEPGSGDERAWKTVEFFDLNLNPDAGSGET
jgi:hypothetical protein